MFNTKILTHPVLCDHIQWKPQKCCKPQKFSRYAPFHQVPTSVLPVIHCLFQSISYARRISKQKVYNL